MYFELPLDVIRHIYEFDSTYSDFFSENILPLLKKRIFFFKKSIDSLCY